MRFRAFRWLAGCGLIAFAAFSSSPAYAAVPFEDTLAQRTLACTACHGQQGRAGPDGYYPRIAGKPAGYLYNQLLNLRDGRRHYPLMTGLLDPLSDSYLLEIAQYFSKLDVPYPAPAATTAQPADLQRGETLATRGDAAKKIPACMQCHGKALTGVAPHIPGLLGLPRDYINAQLGGWQTGQRAAHAPDCMAQIAKQMSAQDVTAVAAWLSSQPLPADTHPATSLPMAQAADIKMSCGSAPVFAANSSGATPFKSPTSAAAPTPAAPPGPLTAPVPAVPAANSAQVARGAYLARAGNCMGCHTTRGGVPWAGGRGIDTPFGTVFSSNLTPDAATGLGNWSAEDFWGALHHGRSKEGRMLYPAFPYTNYTQVSRTDADALFAYLRSLPKTAQANRNHALRWPYSTQAALYAWRSLYFTPGAPTAVSGKSALWNRGAYLVQGLGHCSACHTTRNALGGSAQQLDMAGGLIPMQNWYAPSLSSASEASVGGWDTPQVVALLKTGMSQRGTVLGPMADVVLGSTQHLTDDDLTAMAVYLKDLPGARSALVSGPSAAAPATLSPQSTVTTSARALDRGAKIYEKHCVDCHGSTGAGVQGAYPPLAGNRAVTLPQVANLVQVVMYGGFAPATQGNPRPYGMPPYVLQLGDADIAAVLTYIRSAWGNTAPAVTELDVNRFRSVKK